jgi:hypothetical protein
VDLEQQQAHTSQSSTYSTAMKLLPMASLTVADLVDEAICAGVHQQLRRTISMNGRRRGGSFRPQFGDRKGEILHPGGLAAAPITVAVAEALLASLMTFSTRNQARRGSGPRHICPPVARPAQVGRDRFWPAPITEGAWPPPTPSGWEAGGLTPLAERQRRGKRKICYDRLKRVSL